MERNVMSGVDATLCTLADLRDMPADWLAHGLTPIDPDILDAAERFVLSLPGNLLASPKVVPMTRGRLQFEWHRGGRSLELEFETSTRIHYLKWDPASGTEDEDTLPAADTASILALLRWFATESVDV